MFYDRYLCQFSCALVFFALTGCQQSQDGPGRFELTGEITIDGKPVPAGEIMFEPDSSKGNSGPAGVAEIKDGRYTTTPTFGTVGGPHIAVISANSGGGMRENGETPAGWLLLDSYRMPIDLPKKNHTENIEISSAEAKKK
tara:strand:- start:69005 stop:69427 length:423 start_codon:yes stop_codon:yes gene_type:complete